MSIPMGPLPKRCKVAVSSPSINHRRRVFAGSLCRFWVLKCHLINKNKRYLTGKLKKRRWRGEEEKMAYKTIAFWSSSVIVGNDDGFKYLSKLLEIAIQGVSLSLPSQTSNKDLGICWVTKLLLLLIVFTATHLELPLEIWRATITRPAQDTKDPPNFENRRPQMKEKE